MAVVAPAPTPKKSNTCLIIVIILALLGLLFVAGGVVFLKVVPSLIMKNLTGDTTGQNPLEKFIGGITGGNGGTIPGGLGGLIPGGDGGSGGGGSGGLSDEDLALQKCTPGKSALGVGIGAGWAYTGKNKFSVGGKTVELCCMAPYDLTQGQPLGATDVMMCGDGNDNLVYLQKVDGKLVPYMAGYKKDGKDCSQIYDEAGNVASNYCDEQ